MPEEDLETGDLKESIDQRLEEHEHAEHGAHGGGGHAKQPAAWTRYLSLSTAIIAVIAAVASLESGGNSNEAILEKSQAMLYEAQAADKWALYQAKSIKQSLSEDMDDLWSGMQGKPGEPGAAPAAPAAAAPAADTHEEAKAAETKAGEPKASEAKPEGKSEGKAGEGKPEGEGGEGGKPHAKHGPPTMADKIARLNRLGGEAERYDREKEETMKEARELEDKVKESNDASDARMKHHETFAVSVTLLQIAIALSAIAALTRRKPLWFVSIAVSFAGLVWFVRGFM